MADFINFNGKIINLNNINYIEQHQQVSSSELIIHMVGEKLKFTYLKEDLKRLELLINRNKSLDNG